jgi:head-tail adaptor
MIPTPAGKMRHKVSLIQRDDGTEENEIGEKILQPVTLGTVRCWVKPIKAEEILANAENTQSVSHEVRMVYSTSLTSLLTHADSLLFGTRVLDINSIVNIEEENRELLLTCSERQP